MRPFRSCRGLRISEPQFTYRLGSPNHDPSFTFPWLIEGITRLEPLDVLPQKVEVDAHFRSVHDTRANLSCVKISVDETNQSLRQELPL